MDEQKLEEKCESFVNEGGKIMQCNNPGKKRYDNGLYAGIHCDACWDKLIYTARQKSW